MLILFLNNLYKKPIEYQLLWIYILGQIDDGNTSTIQLKKLKKQFNYNKSTFYRVLRFGLKFFNTENNGVCIELTKQSLIINVVRNRNVTIEKNIEKNNGKSLKSINEKTMKIIDEKTIKVVDKKTIEKPLKSINKKTTKSNNDLIKKIIDYLNEKTNKKFTIKNKQTLRFINGRIKDGYNENDFKKVIDIKTEKWLNTSMGDYLRPQTLFSQKMESYLNEKNNKKKPNERFQKTQSAVDKAKQVDWFNKE
tara:strand:+ start:3236 stop:3988 length:753 start_codon:yes stop_codon:yes gene_type:complete